MVVNISSSPVAKFSTVMSRVANGKYQWTKDSKEYYQTPFADTRTHVKEGDSPVPQFAPLPLLCPVSFERLLQPAIADMCSKQTMAAGPSAARRTRIISGLFPEVGQNLQEISVSNLSRAPNLASSTFRRWGQLDNTYPVKADLFCEPMDVSPPAVKSAFI